MSGGERCDRVIEIIDEALADYERWQQDHAALVRNSARAPRPTSFGQGAMGSAAQATKAGAAVDA